MQERPAGQLQCLVRPRQATALFTATRLHTVAQGWPRSGLPWVTEPNDWLTLKALNNRHDRLCSAFGVEHPAALHQSSLETSGGIEIARVARGLTPATC